MALKKQIKDKGANTLVTFSIGENEAPSSSNVLLLGDFNNWQSNDSTFQMEKKGNTYVKSIRLENGKRYEFRYLSDDKGWFNDHAADDYVPSPYTGIQNSVVDLSKIPLKEKPLKKTIKKASAKPIAKTVKKSKKDDLKKIEGIGPKIATILTENGLGTFEKLSKASVKVLEGILKEAGSRYAMHKPNSWPKQAKLASADKWDELKKTTR